MQTSTAEKPENGFYTKSKYFVAVTGFPAVERPQFLCYVGLDEPDKKAISPGIASGDYTNPRMLYEILDGIAELKTVEVEQKQ